jgi:hypothetical protein
MGRTLARFGRNFSFQYCYPEEPPALYQPSPRLISQRLLARDQFVPATTLNLLAAAWIQFQTHDWFNHGDGSPENAMELELADDDPWFEHPMRITRTPADPTRIPGANDGPPTFVNQVSHWWDASLLYHRLHTGGPHARRHALDQRQQHDHRVAAPLSPVATGPGPDEKRLCPVAAIVTTASTSVPGCLWAVEAVLYRRCSSNKHRRYETASTVVCDGQSRLSGGDQKPLGRAGGFWSPPGSWPTVKRSNFGYTMATNQHHRSLKSIG